MAAESLAPIYVGCSGWQYTGWRGRFYPEGLPANQYFPFYAQHFDTVEINSTFYRMPTPEVVRHWRAMAPPGFLFAVKANRFLTHRKKLHEVERILDQFFRTISELGEHLGPVLYQLPPGWKCNVERLAAFLTQLPPGHVHAFEFRHPSWFEPRVRQLLAEAGAVFVVHDFPGLRVPRVRVGPAVYVRFHGPIPGYAGRYSRPRLRRWARWLRAQARAGKACYAYFNNDVEAAAVQDALYLRALVQQRRVAAGHGER
ncbi:MAG: hypothetical protein KatS3mg077_1605 [Candidatus Binatia bacterium]|nr:MAG: hypothetical protein KatS3mg077_1605 [Candidatus Binatia bacterium]